MSSTVTSSCSDYESRVITQTQQLSPRPKCEIFTIAFLPFFEIFRRLPKVTLSELLFVRNVSAIRQKSSKLANRFALYRQGLTNITAHRDAWMRALTAEKWLGDLYSSRIVEVRNDFGDHASGPDSIIVTVTDRYLTLVLQHFLQCRAQPHRPVLIFLPSKNSAH